MELGDLLFVESSEVLLELVPELSEQHNQMARIKIMKALGSECGWMGDPKPQLPINSARKAGKFVELDLNHYTGLLNMGFSIPLFVVIMAVMKHGLLPLDRTDMLSVMNVIWAAIVSATGTLYMAPGDSRLVAAVLGRLFPQMHRQKGFKGFDFKLVDFMQNVRQNKIKSLEVPNTPAFSPLLEQYPDKVPNLVESIDDIGSYKRSIYMTTIKATLTSGEPVNTTVAQALTFALISVHNYLLCLDYCTQLSSPASLPLLRCTGVDAKGSENRSTAMHVAALQAMLGTEVGKLLDQDCVDFLESSFSKEAPPQQKKTGKNTKPKPTVTAEEQTEEEHTEEEQTPGPCTQSQPSRAKGTPASAAAAISVSGDKNPLALKAGIMKPRCRVEGGDQEITTFLTKSLVSAISGPVIDVTETNTHSDGTAKAAPSGDAENKGLPKNKRKSKCNPVAISKVTVGKKLWHVEWKEVKVLEVMRGSNVVDCAKVEVCSTKETKLTPIERNFYQRDPQGAEATGKDKPVKRAKIVKKGEEQRKHCETEATMSSIGEESGVRSTNDEAVAGNDTAENAQGGNDNDGSDGNDFLPFKVLVARMYSGKQEYLVQWADYSAKLKDLTWEKVGVMNSTKEGKAAKKAYIEWARAQEPLQWPPMCGVDARDYCDPED